MKKFWNILKYELGLGMLIFIGIVIILVFCLNVFNGDSILITAISVIFSVLFTWGFSVGTALLIKYKIAKRPLKTLSSFLITATIYIIQLVVAVLLNTSHTHNALLVVSYFVFRILHRGAKEIAPLSKQSTQSVQCPQCGLLCPLNTLVCDCGYRFQPTTPNNTANTSNQPVVNAPYQQAPTQEYALHTLTYEGTIKESYVNVANLKFDYKKYLDEQNHLYVYEERQNNKIVKIITYKSDWYNLMYAKHSEKNQKLR